ncbi:Tryptophan 2-C-methyltransferase [Pontiella desulfatans]|uniref:Tryptophan 2-C-methyltransferase n=1 Tax=Pontiella desulfatans TaxID=2750659 RepID=A0A6C2TXI4_PONDE|nr:lipid biosynthesis B12-binding/radical SAM protein [Pontiella desulfatans]VGO12051.1 Tryptophan 2-C-methyltransferase [Pontiella desulfatans]
MSDNSKILLISTNWETSPYPVYPIGMGMVAAALKRAGHQVELFDFLQSGCSFDALKERVAAVRPDVVGLSLRNIDNVNAVNEHRYIDSVKQIAESVRQTSPAPIILGGSAFSIMPEEILAKVGADYGVVGEGEVLMCSFMELLEAGQLPAERILRAPQNLEKDAIPSAYYEPAMVDYYMAHGKTISIQTKRGCDKHCIYCSYPFLEGRNFRMRNAVDVVDDIERLVADREDSYIFFVDSVFNDNGGNYRDIVHEMHRRELCIPWTAYISPGGELDDEMFALMKATGFDAAEIGADAASDIALKGIGKDFTWQDVIDCNDLFRRHGITTAHYYMFGGPGETKETVLEGIENIRNLEQTANFMFMGIRILPGTGLMKIAQREGLVTDKTDIVEPIYYISKEVDRDWLETTLTEGFADKFNCVFPPDALDDKLHLLHKLGYGGTAYDMLIGAGKRKRRKRTT